VWKQAAISSAKLRDVWPKIVRPSPNALASSVVTTDFFDFDTSDNHYGLQGLGDVSAMGDAILGLVSSQKGASSPRWLAMRNVSDPQIKADGMALKQQLPSLRKSTRALVAGVPCAARSCAGALIAAE